MYRITRLFFLVGACFFASILVSPVWAAAYGTGPYGAGQYGVGQTAQSDNTGSSSNDASSSGSSQPSDPSCTASKPSSTPDLFQISTGRDSVTLYFSPSSGNRDRYFISYGDKTSAEGYGFEFPSSSTGVVAVTVQALRPRSMYTFRVRAGNGCQPGEWSNSLSVTTGQRLPSYRWSSVGRVVSTSVRRTVKPQSMQRQTVEITTPMVPSLPTPPPALSTETTVPSPAPTFFGRARQFLRGLFGR